MQAGEIGEKLSTLQGENFVDRCIKHWNKWRHAHAICTSKGTDSVAA